MISQKPLTTTTKSDKVDTMNDNLELAEVMFNLLWDLGNSVQLGTANDLEISFHQSNAGWLDRLDDWLSDEVEFTSQDKEDVMELWVTAKGQMLI